MLDEKTPTFKDVLDDPITVAVMDRDGVSRNDLWSLMATMRNRLNHPAPQLMA